MMEPLVFNRSAPFTLGVELEFQILESGSLNLTPMAPELLASVPVHLKEKFKPEFIQSMLEITTGICTNMAEVEKDLRESCLVLEALAEKTGCLTYAASLHPFATAREQALSAGGRYARIMEELQLVGRRLITQGLHIHVGLADGETAVSVCDNIRAFLPVLLAITTSSPFFEGEDSGLYSYRSKLFAALPRAGMPGAFGSWGRYSALVRLLMEANIIREVRDLWWDVRPHPDFGTVEIRICDLPSRFDEVLAVAALVHSLVFTLAAEKACRRFTWEILLNNKWEAARYGLEGRFVDPVVFTTLTLENAARDLLDMVRPAAAELGNLEFLKPLKRILEEGTSAHRQKQLYADSCDFGTVIETIRGDFWK